MIIEYTPHSFLYVMCMRRKKKKANSMNGIISHNDEIGVICMVINSISFSLLALYVCAYDDIDLYDMKNANAAQ